MNSDTNLEAILPFENLEELIKRVKISLSSIPLDEITNLASNTYLKSIQINRYFAYLIGMVCYTIKVREGDNYEDYCREYLEDIPETTRKRYTKYYQGCLIDGVLLE